MWANYAGCVLTQVSSQACIQTALTLPLLIVSCVLSALHIKEISNVICVMLLSRDMLWVLQLVPCRRIYTRCKAVEVLMLACSSV